MSKRYQSFGYDMRGGNEILGNFSDLNKAIQSVKADSGQFGAVYDNKKDAFVFSKKPPAYRESEKLQKQSAVLLGALQRIANCPPGILNSFEACRQIAKRAIAQVSLKKLKG